jgi:hypothetical protein
MIDTDSTLLLDIWRAVEDFIPNNKKDDVAETIVALFIDADVDKAFFNEIIGEDRHIDKAIALLTEDDEEPEEEEDDY